MTKVEVLLTRISVAGPEDLALLSVDERLRAANFRDPSGFIAVRATLRRWLGKHTGTHPAQLRFEYNEHGAPRLAGHNLHFSVSHKQDLAIMALASWRVGIDLELIDTTVDWASVARRTFSSEEQARAGNDTTRCTRYWTAKEAYTKAIGAGFRYGFREVSIDDRVGLSVHDPKATTPWQCLAIPVALPYICTLVVEADAMPHVLLSNCTGQMPAPSKQEKGNVEHVQ